MTTERQKVWSATLERNLADRTGRSLEAWLEIARSAPHAGHRARLAWLREQHGLGQNHASLVLARAFPGEGIGWDDPERLRAALWGDARARAVLEALEVVANATGDVVTTQRKGYTSFSRQVQFAAIRPLRGDSALLGLKLEPETSPRLMPPRRRESWSERLAAVVELGDASAVDGEIARLFSAAAERG